MASYRTDNPYSRLNPRLASGDQDFLQEALLSEEMEGTRTASLPKVDMAKGPLNFAGEGGGGIPGLAGLAGMFRDASGYDPNPRGFSGPPVRESGTPTSRTTYFDPSGRTLGASAGDFNRNTAAGLLQSRVASPRVSPLGFDDGSGMFGPAQNPNRNSTMPVGPGVNSGITDPAPSGSSAPGAQAGAFGDVNGPNGRAARNALGGYNNVGTMSGFNTSLDYGGDDKAPASMKNTFGRIASRYPNNRAGLEALMNDPDFKRYFPNARLGPEGGRGGVIDFGGQLSDFESGVPVGAVDVLGAYDGENATQWHWLDQNFAGDAGGGAMGGTNLPPDLLAALSGLGDGGGTLEDIQRELQAIINGQPSPMNQGYLQQLLNGGGQ